MLELPAPHRENDVAGPEGLATAVASLAAAPAVALDVETNSMHAYRARLCFVQAATEGELFVIDTLAEGVDPAALGPMLADPKVQKIFHDAQGDLRTLVKYGLVAENLFDTHRAATLLGLPKVGLGDLVQTRFGVALKKEHQTSDFGRRPLPPEIRSYVADDVRYLLPLARDLQREAQEQDVAEELALECARVAAESRTPENLPTPKLPNQAKNPRGYAIAAAIDAIRHREAEKRNVPVGRVLSNAVVGEIAAAAPREKSALAKTNGFYGPARALSDEILAEIARVVELDQSGQLPPLVRPPAPRPDPGRRDRETRVRDLRAKLATARKVTPMVVLPAPILEALVSAPPKDLEALAATPWLGEKRVRLYGEQLLAALKD